jgi:hypothetical protein
VLNLLNKGSWLNYCIDLQCKGFGEFLLALESESHWTHASGKDISISNLDFMQLNEDK